MNHAELLARRDGIEKILAHFIKNPTHARERANNIAAALQDGGEEPFNAAWVMLARVVPDEDLRRKAAEQIETYWYAKEGVSL